MTGARAPRLLCSVRVAVKRLSYSATTRGTGTAIGLKVLSGRTRDGCMMAHRGTRTLGTGATF